MLGAREEPSDLLWRTWQTTVIAVYVLSPLMGRNSSDMDNWPN